MVLSLFVVSALDELPDGAAELDELLDGVEALDDGVEALDDGVELDEDDEDGVLVEPAPAEPLWSFLLMSTEVEDELEPEGAGVAAVPPADDEDDEPAGARVAPDGDVVPEVELEARSLVRSQAAINEAPSASETATAMVESLMRPPWLGYRYWGARIGPRLLND